MFFNVNDDSSVNITGGISSGDITDSDTTDTTDLYKSYDDITSSVVGSSNQTNVSVVKNDTEMIVNYDLLEALPANASLKQTNISLYGIKSNGALSLIKAGMPLQACDYKVSSEYTSLQLKSNVEYESVAGDYSSATNDSVLTIGDTPITLDLKTETSKFQSNQDLINYLLAEISGLKSRIGVLEL